jgi:pimeloyl-ACP methyl ester carboxylesterase
MTTTTALSYGTAPNQVIHADNGIDYAYREIGTGTVALVLLQHFRGNLENWDPPLVDALASQRRVVAFDNAGVGATTGTTPSTIEQMARDAIAFIAALDDPLVDILGFSIGSFVAQEIALIRPDMVRRLVLASSAPRGGAGMHGWAPEVLNAVGQPQPDPKGYLDVFFTSSAASQQAGQQTLGRIYGRTTDVDKPTSWATRQAQYDAVCDWGIPNHAALQRVSAIGHPVFIANGDGDPMIPPHFSYLLAGLIPRASVKIYPDAAHGFLFQHAGEFAADVAKFLDDSSLISGPSKPSRK